jgi:penicillin-insensitive murein endopeptidase
MPNGDRWWLVDPEQSWGTRETIEFLIACIDKVNDQFPNTEKLKVGDISRKKGGYFVPHVSHQSGRDIDTSYYYTTPQNWYMRADASNLDLPRTWALVRAMVTETDVEMILIDRSLQKLLKAYALEVGEDPAWLDTVFGGETTTLRPLVRHAKGHKTHIHVRFYNPIAQETGRRVYRKMIEHKMISPPTYYIKYKVKRGDTLSRMAKRFKTSVKALKRANGLRTSRIYAGRKYRIPRRGGVRMENGPLVIPSRRLPPFDPPVVPPPEKKPEDSAEAADKAPDPSAAPAPPPGD